MPARRLIPKGVRNLNFLNSGVFAIAPPWEWPGNVIEEIGKKAGGEAFTWILNVIADAFNSVVKSMEKGYAHAAAVKPQGEVLDYFFGSAVGFARYLAWVSFAIALILVVIPGNGRFIVRAVKVMLGIMLVPLFFIVLDWLPAIQGTLSKAAVDIYSPAGKYADQPLLLIPVADNPLFALMGMGWVVTWGGALLLVFKGYAVVGMIACLLLLPFFALSVIFDFALKFLNILISTIIVTKIAGIPLALFIMKAAEALSQNVAVLNDPLGQTVCIGFGLLFAWVAQFGLFWACLKVVSPVTGKIYSHGKTKAQVMGGKLKAETTEKRRERRNAAYSNMFRDSGRRPSHGRVSGSTSVATAAAKRRSIKAGAAMLAKRYPQTAVALKAASVAQAARPAQKTPVATGSRNGNSDGSSNSSDPSSRNGSSGGQNS
jgi:hypothetical protein